MSFCIPKVVNRKIKKALEDGSFEYRIDEGIHNGKHRYTTVRYDFNLEKILKMAPDERQEIFTKLAGKQYSENISKRFGSKFNTDVTEEQVADIVGDMVKVNKLRAEYEASGKAPITNEAWMKKENAPKWAREYIGISNKVNNIVNPRNNMGITKAFGHYLREGKDYIKASEDASQAIGRTALFVGDTLTSPVLKSLKASMDLSFALRQGFKVATMNKSSYATAMKDAFSQAFQNKETGQAAFNEFQARMISHPYYERLVTNGKLAIGAAEEFFPTSVGDRVPVLGKLFERSNNAFTVFSQSARMQLASNLLEKYKLVSGDLTPESTKLLKDITYIANSVTGRGGLSKLESFGPALNRIFFAPRYIRSAVDTFALPLDPTLSTEIRKEAQVHLVKTLGSIGALMGVASLFGEVDTNPKSTNFGYFKVPGSTATVDLTAGLGQYIRLATQTATREKIDAKGHKKILGNLHEYKPETVGSTWADFFKYKLAPAPSLAFQVYSDRELYGGRKITPMNLAREAVAPISPNNAVDYLTNEETATALGLIVGEALGAGIKTPKY